MNTQQLCFRIMLLIISVALLFVHMLMEQLKSHSSEMKEDVGVMDDGKNG